MRLGDVVDMLPAYRRIAPRDAGSKTRRLRPLHPPPLAFLSGMGEGAVDLDIVVVVDNTEVGYSIYIAVQFAVHRTMGDTHP